MAGVSTKEIKSRIRSMQATRQITKAMEMVAASKLRRAQTQVMAARPYFETMYGVIHSIADTDRELSSPYLQERAGNKALYVVVAGDRGLAGGYNSNLLKLVMSDIQGKDATVLPIGKKTGEFFQSRKIPCLTEYSSQAAAMSMSDCFTVAKQLCKLFQEGAYDEVYVTYTNFVSVLSQMPGTLRLLPLIRQKSKREKQTADIVYEPDSQQVFDAIIPGYVGGVLYGALCESRASEQAARRTAMDSATQNATEMIADLRLKFNRARQASVTQEITEIVAGSG